MLLVAFVLMNEARYVLAAASDGCWNRSCRNRRTSSSVQLRQQSRLHLQLALVGIRAAAAFSGSKLSIALFTRENGMVYEALVLL